MYCSRNELVERAKTKLSDKVKNKFLLKAMDSKESATRNKLKNLCRIPYNEWPIQIRQCTLLPQGEKEIERDSIHGLGEQKALIGRQIDKGKAR